MDIKYQVFVSSTYKDLIEERKEVIHALLELDCIPAGMELFPATDEDAWSLIKEIVDDCDYYILIIGGKYGSINSKGIGYTEMEYDYAVESQKPILCFLHENIDDLPSSKVEKSDIGKKRLSTFREKVEKRHCKYWSTPHDLGGKVSRGLVKLKKRHPAEGWVPGRFAADAKMLREFEEMRAKLAKLEIEAITGKNTPPPEAEMFEQGSSTFPCELHLKVSENSDKEEVIASPSWDKIFSYCGSSLSGECDDNELERKIQLAYWHSVPNEFMEFNSCHADVVIPYVVLDQIKVQLQALGLIAPGDKKRAVSDTRTYWKMTPYGERYLIQIKAIKRKNPDDSPKNEELIDF